jgi:hypothetical protein
MNGPESGPVSVTTAEFEFEKVMQTSFVPELTWTLEASLQLGASRLHCSGATRAAALFNLGVVDVLSMVAEVIQLTLNVK